MNNKYNKKSIRAYPFKSGKLTPEEKLFKSTLDEWYSAKHRPPDFRTSFSII